MRPSREVRQKRTPIVVYVFSSFRCNRVKILHNKYVDHIEVNYFLSHYEGFGRLETVEFQKIKQN